MVRALIIPPGPWGTAGPGPPLRIIPAPAVPRLLRGDARTRLCSGVHLSPILSPCLLVPCDIHPAVTPAKVALLLLLEMLGTSWKHFCKFLSSNNRLVCID